MEAGLFQYYLGPRNRSDFIHSHLPVEAGLFSYYLGPRESEAVAIFPMFVSNSYGTIAFSRPEHSVLDNNVSHSEQDNLEFNLQVTVA